jgi:hypothetical protein
MFMCITYSCVLSTFHCMLSVCFVRLICTLYSCLLSIFNCMLSLCRTDNIQSMVDITKLYQNGRRCQQHSKYIYTLTDKILLLFLESPFSITLWVKHDYIIKNGCLLLFNYNHKTTQQMNLF